MNWNSWRFSDIRILDEQGREILCAIDGAVPLRDGQRFIMEVAPTRTEREERQQARAAGSSNDERGAAAGADSWEWHGGLEENWRHHRNRQQREEDEDEAVPDEAAPDEAVPAQPAAADEAEPAQPAAPPGTPLPPTPPLDEYSQRQLDGTTERVAPFFVRSPSTPEAVPAAAPDEAVQHDGEGGNSFQSDSDTDGYGGFDHAEWNGRYSYTDDEMDQDDGTGVAVDQDDGASQR